MYQNLDYRAFVEMLYQLCLDRKSGFIFFSTPDDAWGKIKLHQGNIIGFGYRAIWGERAIGEFQKIPAMRCFFQQKTRADDAAPARDASLPATTELLARLLSEEHKQALARVKQDLEGHQQQIDLEEAITRPQRAAGSKVVLIADDSRMARAILSKPLVAAGYDVREARDGFEAIGLAQDSPPDLVLLDVNMPGIDGFKVLDTLRRNRRTKHLPILMLAQDNGILDRLKGKMAACDEYLVKPVDSAELLQLVRKHINLPG